MRIAGLVVGSLFAAGCLAPFSWPDVRTATAVEAVAEANAEAAPDHLALAAERIDRGDDAGALPHLAAHVAANPDAVMMRAYLAELHLRLGDSDSARTEFERVVATAQEATAKPIRKQLVHCHTRLMEIAETHADAYSENLHRGIGLWLLVRSWDADPTRTDDAEAERTLAKAAAALRAARDEGNSDARANVYLAAVYDRLEQPAAASAARRAARSSLPDSRLSVWEREQIAE